MSNVLERVSSKSRNGCLTTFQRYEVITLATELEVFRITQVPVLRWQLRPIIKRLAPYYHYNSRC